jgi:hypothetical protein
MKKLIVALLTLTTTASFASTPQDLQKCAQGYALTAVEEYNLPNEAVVSIQPEAKEATLKGLQHTLAQKYVDQAIALFPKYEALGLIIQYSDEVQLIYVGINLVHGQCQVRAIADTNTVDLNGSDIGLKPEDAPLFFLNYTKSDLEKMLGPDSTIGDVYDVVVETLGYN